MSPEPPLHKADFGTIYDRPDPRAYYATLEPLDYAIPQHGCDVAARLLEVLEARGRADPDGPRRLLLLRRAGDAAQDRPGPRQAHRALHVPGPLGADRRGAARRRPCGAGDAPAPAGATGRRPRRRRSRRRLRREHRRARRGRRREPGARRPQRRAGRAAARGRPGHHHRRRRLRHRGDVRRAGRPGPGLDLVRHLLPADLRLHAGRRRLRASRAAHRDRTEDRPAATLHRRRRAALGGAEARALGFDTAGKEEAGSFHAELHVSRPEADADALPLQELLPAFGG